MQATPHPTPISASDEERVRFCIRGQGRTGPLRAANAFPSTTSERRAWLFGLTGYAPTKKDLGEREWYLLNYSMNQGLSMGLDDTTLQMLSLMDYGLSGVPRWINMKFMSPERGDSTAAHTKQVMNDVQHVFDKAFDGKCPKDMESMRQNALLGAWVHDMGEIVFELTTATDMFHITDPAEAKSVQDAKEHLEKDLVQFGCELALKQVNEDRPGLFIEHIRQLRALYLAVPKEEGGLLGSTGHRVERRIAAIRQGMETIRDELKLPKDPSPPVQRILAIYDQAEIAAPGNFLHPLIKTIECVEGQRYLQKNTAENEMRRNQRQLADMHAPNSMAYHLVSDHEIVSSCRRSERRLPMLYQEAGTDTGKKKLADATAAFAYRSLARQFDPGPMDAVGEGPSIIDRAAAVTSDLESGYRDKKGYAVTQPLTPSDIATIRQQEHAYKQQQLDKQSPDDPDARFQARASLGRIYRAAEHLAEQQRIPVDFFAPDQPGENIKPTRDSLMSIAPGYRIPAAVREQMTRDRVVDAKVAHPTPSSHSRKL